MNLVKIILLNDDKFKSDYYLYNEKMAMKRKLLGISDKYDTYDMEFLDVIMDKSDAVVILHPELPSKMGESRFLFDNIFYRYSGMMDKIYMMMGNRKNSLIEPRKQAVEDYDYSETSEFLSRLKSCTLLLWTIHKLLPIDIRHTYLTELINENRQKLQEIDRELAEKCKITDFSTEYLDKIHQFVKSGRKKELMDLRGEAVAKLHKGTNFYFLHNTTTMSCPRIYRDTNTNTLILFKSHMRTARITMSHFINKLSAYFGYKIYIEGIADKGFKYELYVDPSIDKDTLLEVCYDLLCRHNLDSAIGECSYSRSFNCKPEYTRAFNLKRYLEDKEYSRSIKFDIIE